MKTITMSDVAVDLNAIRVLCDVAVSYAVNEGDNDAGAVNKFNTMLQIIQEKVEALDDAVNGIVK